MELLVTIELFLRLFAFFLLIIKKLHLTISIFVLYVMISVDLLNAY